MAQIETFETCPVCGGRGTRRKRHGITRRDTPKENRCVACRGDGSIPASHLRKLVLLGVRAMAER